MAADALNANVKRSRWGRPPYPRRGRLSAFGAAIFVALTPALALACPYCAAGSNGGSIRAALGAFLLLPFGVAGVVYTVLRREAE